MIVYTIDIVRNRRAVQAAISQERTIAQIIGPNPHWIYGIVGSSIRVKSIGAGRRV